MIYNLKLGIVKRIPYILSNHHLNYLVDPKVQLFLLNQQAPT